MPTTLAPRLTALALALGALAACDDAPTASAPDLGAPRFQAITSTENVRVPVETANPEAFVPCANGGAGEIVDLSGDLHILTHTTVDETGVVHTKIHIQPQGVIGIGRETGDVYRGTGATQEEIRSVDGLPVVDTYTNAFGLIGPGPGNNLLFHDTIHITINANGEVTAEVENVRTECR